MSCIYVSPHEQRFIRPFRLGVKLEAEAVIPNGIRTDLLLKHLPKPVRHDKFTFLAYGGRNSQKRIDILVKAGELLSRESKDFEILITKGVDTLDVLNEIYHNGYPSWLKPIPQNTDITKILSMADCFVSTSRRETFSFAICEASVYGLPVIQSDIEGTRWNANNPSTFLFRNLDYKDLAKKMAQLMKIPTNELFEKCMETRKSNALNYSMEAWVEKIINFYKANA